MNPETSQNAVNKVNKVIFIIFLLFAITGAGVYGSLKFKELYKQLLNPVVQTTVVQEMNNEEKEDMLAEVASNSSSDVEEKEKLSMLRNLALQSTIDTQSREAMLDSLR